MKYYKHHLGDFLAKTLGLTATERGIYLLMMHVYYITEEPLPLDLNEVCRAVGALKKHEFVAVENIIHRFFIKTETGFVNERCEEEIRQNREYREEQAKYGRVGGQNKKGSLKGSLSKNEGYPKPTTNHKPLTNNHLNNSAGNSETNVALVPDFTADADRLEQARGLSDQFDENDFATLVMAEWRDTKIGRVSAPFEEVELRKQWRQYGTAKVIQAIQLFARGGYKKLGNIGEHLAGRKLMTASTPPELTNTSERLDRTTKPRPNLLTPWKEGVERPDFAQVERTGGKAHQEPSRTNSPGTAPLIASGGVQ